MIFDKAHLKSLFEISHIRVQKLLHLSQHGSITALITILFGKIIKINITSASMTVIGKKMVVEELVLMTYSR